MGKVGPAHVQNAVCVDVKIEQKLSLERSALDALTRDEMQRFLVDVWRETKKTIVYVTHNVAEAVYLADRIAIFTPHPGTVKAEVKVSLTRPRDPLSVEFVEVQKRVVAELR